MTSMMIPLAVLLCVVNAQEFESLTFTELRWLWTEDNTTNLEMCATNIPAGNATLVLIVDDQIYDFEATVEADLNCVNFSTNEIQPLPSGSARYEVFIFDSESNEVLARGSTTFNITVETTLLYCGNEPLTKITWTGEEVLSDDNFLSYTGNPDKVYYYKGDLTGTEICFTIQDDNGNNVTVCLNGPADHSPHSDGSELSANYLAYGDEGEKLSTLSLNFGVEHDELRVIVRTASDPASPGTPGTPEVILCDQDDDCPLTYDVGYVTYEVCAEAISGGITVQTDVITFIDLRLYTFPADTREDSILVEFAFANGLEERKYTANLYLTAPPDLGNASDTVNVDCTGVDSGHACFGFLSAPAGTETAYVALSGQDYNNTVISTYTSS